MGKSSSIIFNDGTVYCYTLKSAFLRMMAAEKVFGPRGSRRNIYERFGGKEGLFSAVILVPASFILNGSIFLGFSDNPFNKKGCVFLFLLNDRDKISAATS